ncbi:(2Fe-2S)-binding protein [Reichenbachiella carrageenanivorans]|uniref:(2Fe-2S)-binding protein n=1 Tax=Reichenbachiella carrageenanivorans TaxID=2979869 RepID=A0ABY6D512_9BACT|nr:(2Fe-2S)-binding protein [Reichenbachiella carrageenanivorans]UXX80208.1 (2Fe-2S)-binding protein [Reichenbachiella carrageenanivorans]
MPKIVIQNLHNKEIFIKNENKNLLDIIHENYIDWMHACGGKGRCTTCKVQVLEGMENFSEVSPAELKFRGMNRLQSNERLSCQCQVSGDVVVRVAPENKFNHIQYSD